VGQKPPIFVLHLSASHLITHLIQILAIAAQPHYGRSSSLPMQVSCSAHESLKDTRRGVVRIKGLHTIWLVSSSSGQGHCSSPGICDGVQSRFALGPFPATCACSRASSSSAPITSPICISGGISDRSAKPRMRQYRGVLSPDSPGQTTKTTAFHEAALSHKVRQGYQQVVLAPTLSLPD
jgi:hypothetical protein